MFFFSPQPFAVVAVINQGISEVIIPGSSGSDNDNENDDKSNDGIIEKLGGLFKSWNSIG